MKHQPWHRIAWFAFGLTAATLAMSLPPGLAASTDDPGAMAPTPHSHGATQPMPRLQPKRVVTVTGNEDWDALRGFGKDSQMAAMMTLMMVGGSGMEHMKMAPMKPGMKMAAMPTAVSGGTNATPRLPLAVTISPNPPVVGDNTLDIAVTDAGGQPVAGLQLAASVAMTSMDMGTTKPKVAEGPNGHYTTVVNLSMKGPWRVMLTGSAPGNKAAGTIRIALDFNVGSTQKWGQPASPTTAPASPGTHTAGGPAGPHVALNTPADTLKVGKNTLQFIILDAAGQPVTGAKVTTAVAMTSMDMGTAHPQAREGKDGRYTTEVEFSMKGPWRVTVNVTPPNRVPPEGRVMPFTRAFDFNIVE